MSALDHAQALVEALDVKPAAMNLDQLFPMYTPASFFQSGKWPGPYELLQAKGVGLTWALDLGDGGIRYLDAPMRKYWEAKGTDWKAAAMRNLQRESTALYTHALGRKSGGVFAVAMIHADGRGPSRLLLQEGLSRIFPDGYRATVPEMSCGLAVANRVDAREQASIDALVEKCFHHGTRPLSPGIFPMAELLPSWAFVNQ